MARVVICLSSLFVCLVIGKLEAIAEIIITTQICIFKCIGFIRGNYGWELQYCILQLNPIN